MDETLRENTIYLGHLSRYTSVPMESRVLSILDQSYQNDLQFLSQRLEPVQSNASQQNDDTRNISVMKLQYVLRTPLCQLVPEDKNEKKRKKRRS